MIGRYEIRRRLGEGGMGRVYLARDVVLGRLVALKLVGGTRDVERFLQEARAVARLNHPNVVRLYDFGEHRSFLYLALEYVEGQTLREQVPGDRHIREVLHHIRAVADALSHAHASGVLHCDLKLNNIMIGRDGRIRVVDFGLARTTDSRYSATGGTPDWMAPEQWAGGPITDRVDSWALGIVTAQLLAGAHPLGDNPDTRHRAAQDPSRVASFRCERRDVPAAMIDLVVQSLERNPALRPSTAEWVRMLDDALAGPGDAQPRRRRRRWISLDIALVLVGAAAMAVFLVMGRCAARETDRIDAGEHSARCGSGSE
ncbi:MAG TPA: serine/threonine-protein kinase [Kofleriaceae bacterium]|nr:serine/threonine-protein kinase [Kofleriaceae bacterium]